MFKKKYKYLVSFWYQLENKTSKIQDAYIEINKKINFACYIPKIRQELKKQVENQTREKCNCIGLINWKKLK